MDKIEKIKGWVKKQKKEELARNSIGVITGKALFVDANELLSFLDTLSEEPSKSLQEEIETWIPAHINVKTDEILLANPTELADACKEWGKRIARHFAEWGAEHLRDSTKMIDKSLEEAAEDAVCMAFGCDPAYYGNKAEFSVDECMRLFIAGAEWQKSQMMKEAYVESLIVEDGRIELEGDPLSCLNPIILLPYPQFNPGDKVRILVLKAEEE